jgi:glucose-1-phosphate thymidylyltransferase
MKAIIPVAGAGTRLRPHTYTQPKALMPVAGKPILSHIIDQLVNVGVQEFVFIIGYLGEKVKSFVEEKHAGITAHFINQTDRAGVGHAIWSAKDLIQEQDDLVIILGDTIVDANLKEILSDDHSVIGVKKVQDPRKFGVAVIDENDWITNLVEKPEIPRSNMALVGIYRIREAQKLVQVLDQMIQNGSERKEYQLTDALMEMINQGTKMKAFRVNNWYDLGNMDVLLESNAILLKKFGDLAHQATWQENNVILIEPVSVSEGAQITNSIIGPYVTIGENSIIESSIVKNSIIGSYATIKDVTLFDSLIGNDTSIIGSIQRLNIGDNTEIDLSGDKH